MVRTFAGRLGLMAALSFAPAALAADLVIILNKSDGTASLLDPASGKARATVPVGNAPHEVEVLPGSKTAAVSNYGTREQAGHTLTLIDIDKGVAIGTLELGEGTRPHGLKALSDGRLIVTAEGTKQVLVVDPKARRVTHRIPTGQDISHMVVALQDGSRAFVTNIGSGSVTAVDLASAKLIQNIPTGKGAEGIDLAPDGREVWVTNRGEDTVSILDAKSLAVTATLKVPQFPIRVKFTPDGKRALISCAKSGDVAVFDAAKQKEVGRISLDREAVAGSEQRLFSTQFGKSPVPVGLLMAPDGKRAWVASTNADIVSEIDLGSLKVARRLTAGKEPDGLAGVFQK